MKTINPPFSISISNAHLFEGLFYCKTCHGYKNSTEFHPNYVKVQRPMCKHCRCKSEKAKRTKSPELRILTALRQRLRKIDPKLARLWQNTDISSLLSKFNPKKDPKRFTVVARDPTQRFIPSNAILVTRSEARRLSRSATCK